MSTAELQTIQDRERATCAMPGSPGSTGLRFYLEPARRGLISLYVAPGGSDAADGRSEATAFRTLTRALASIPPGAVANAYEINLAPGDYTIAAESGAMIPAAEAGREAYFTTASDSLFFNFRAGTADQPIVIQGYQPGGGVPRGDARPRLGFRLNFGSVRHVYLKNLRVALPAAAAPHTGQDVAQFHTLPPEPGYPDIRTSHILLRNCELFDGGTPAAPKCHEVLKMNQCQHVYVEECQIHGAYDGDGSNAVDLVAVQYGHVVDCDIYDAPTNWCIYAKGGSAYLRIEGNRIHDALNGFAAGEGTTVAFLERPWWHYEAYAIQFVNNLVYRTRDTAVGVSGGYDVLVAYNTFHNAGITGQVFSLGFGGRNCTTPALCSTRISEGAWGTTSADHVYVIPNHTVLIYNNVVRIDTTTSGFNLFAVAADQPAPGMPPSLRSTPRTAGGPAVVRADEGLEVRGNYVGVAGVADATAAGSFDFVNSPDPDFLTRYRAQNRNDGTVPELNTAAADPAGYLRPAGASSNVFAPVAVSRVAAPPPPSATWLADLPAVSPDTRVAPWPRMHEADLDLDGRCRDAAGPVAGARSAAAAGTPPPPPPAGTLRVVEVEAPAINRVFSGSDSVVVSDTVAAIETDGFLQSRTLPVGEPGTVAEGQYGYEYRIDLTALSTATGMPAIEEMTLDFGAVAALDYNGSGPAHVFVITRGGLGTVGPSSVVQSGDAVTFRFAPPVAAGTGGAEGATSFFFGLTSARAPGDVTARLLSADGRSYTLAARAPR